MMKHPAQRRSIETSVDLTFTIDTTGRILECDGPLLKHAGYSPEKILGLNIRDLLHPEDLPGVENAMYPSGSPFRTHPKLSIRIAGQTGKYVWIECTGWLALIDGQICFRGMGRDITNVKELESRLQRSETLNKVFSTVINAVPTRESVAPILIFMKNSRHQFEHIVNEPLAALFGTTPEVMYGRTDEPFAKSREEFEQWWKDDEFVLQNGGPLYRKEYVTDTNHKLHHYATVKLRVYLGGSPFVLGVATEITEIVHKERQLHWERDRIGYIMDHLPGGVFVKDRQHRFLFANRKQLEFLEIPEDFDILGKTEAELPSSYFRQESTEEEEELFSSGKAVYNAKRIYTNSNGTSRILMLTKVLLPFTEGKEPELIGICRDVTHESALEQKERESKAMLELVLNALPQAVFWKDRHLIYQGCNHGFLRLAQKSQASAVIGSSDVTLFPRDVTRMLQVDRNILIGSRARIDYRESYTLPDGAVHVLETSKLQLTDAAGTVTGVLGVVTGDFNKSNPYSSLAPLLEHAFKTRVFTLEGTLPLLRRRPNIDKPVERMTAAIEAIKAGLQRLLRISMLRRAEGFHVFLLNDVLRTVANLVESEHVSVEPAAESIELFGLPDDLSDVLLELIANGKKAAEKVWVRVERRGAMCRIHVQDNGPGLGQSLEETLRRPINPNRGGIGLALAQFATERLGGCLEEKGGHGKGASFVIILPVFNSKYQYETRTS